MDLTPLEILARPANHLCQLCRRRIESCGTSTPFTATYSGTYAIYARMDDAEWRVHHASLDSFAAGIQQGCYICNTLLEKILMSKACTYSSKLLDICNTLLQKILMSKACTCSSKLLDKRQKGDPNQTDGVVSIAQYHAPEHSTFRCEIYFKFSSDEIGEVKQDFILQDEEESGSSKCIQYVPAGSTDSSSAWEFIRNTMEICENDHDSCRLDLPDTWYPTRLLDLGPEGSTRSCLKLIETRKVEPTGKYVTLSYCWGSQASTTFALNSSNKESLLIQIPDLPKSLEEAIIVTRKLGVRYLWIDGLCIIQGDKTDWATESSAMAKIYSNAWCNIAATASSNSDGGLFRQRKEILSGIDMEYPDSRMFLIDVDDCIHSDTEHAPLQKRGWVLQERLLARRILHFTKRQIVWECNQLFASESFPRGVPRFWRSRLIGKRCQGEFVTEWEDILRRYTSTSLTEPLDKFSALSGLVKSLQDRYGKLIGTKYIAGIWDTDRKDAVMYLAWRCVPPLSFRPTTEYRAPSWSWASTNNKVVFRPIRDPGYRNARLEDVKLKAKLVDYQVVPTTADPTGRISSAFLILEGPLYKIQTQSGERFEATTDGGSIGMSTFFDEPYEGVAEWFTLPLYQYRAEDQDWEWGTDYDVDVYLILEPSKTEANAYERRGICHCSDTESEKLKLITIESNAPYIQFLDKERGYRIRVI